MTVEDEITNRGLSFENFESSNHSFETLALHAGTPPDPITGAMLTPIYQTTTYQQQRVGESKGFTYSRSGNPTVSALEKRLAALEGAEFASCYATGLAATTALCLALLKDGDRIVVSQAVYGGTVRLLRQVLAPFGIDAEFVDTS
ncbi:MAG TPA: PLP-dependent transferase, partial [Candidatus Binatia bacterium]|nr:PLP-dependent transferase [Candidatus Binatia bacterium]